MLSTDFGLIIPDADPAEDLPSCELISEGLSASVLLGKFKTFDGLLSFPSDSLPVVLCFVFNPLLRAVRFLKIS